MVERPGQRVVLGAGGGEGRSGCGKRAFRCVATVGGGGPALLGLDAPRIRVGKRLGGGFGPPLGLVASSGLLAAVADRFELLGEARPLLLGARQLRLRGLAPRTLARKLAALREFFAKNKIEE